MTAKKTKTKKTRTILVDNKRIAWTAVMDDGGKYRLGVVKEGEAGYHPAKEDSDLGGEFACRADAKAVADDLNKRLGLTGRQAAEIIMSSLGRPGR